INNYSRDISAQNKLYTIPVQHGGNSGYPMPASTGIQLHG
ncbi:6272_t:CDS:2, partial [Entrophospora sp. SA101]